MKVLTIIGTIFIPLTFIVGIYWMNFKYMPELDQKRTYPALWGIMLTIVWFMIWYFRKKKWL
jgi:magnesium transporter